MLRFGMPSPGTIALSVSSSPDLPLPSVSPIESTCAWARSAVSVRTHAARTRRTTASQPARDRDLLVGVELEGVAAVDLEVAEEAVARAAEGEVGHRRGDADVDPDHRGGRMARELARGLAARGEDRRRVGVRMRMKQGDRIVERLDRVDRRHRSEDLLVADRYLR